LLVGAGEGTGVTVTVKVTDIRNAKGVVRACMTSDSKKFPRCRDDSVSYKAVVKSAETVTLVFKDVKPGHYAIALLHDENENGKSDRMLGMMPKEGYGFSRDAPVKMAPPKFEQAAFDVGEEAQSQTIKMRYWL
jgi:uncharacterized protein (DUF2141 family)